MRFEQSLPIGQNSIETELPHTPSRSNRFISNPKIFIHLILLLLTALTSVIAGYLWQLSFLSQSDPELVSQVSNPFETPSALSYGIPYAFAVLAILLAHELGHYFTCRFNRIKATLPYVIPAPPFLNPFGTFGAVIRIKSPFRDRKQLFDVGIAGPLAGFALILPAMVIGLMLSTEFTVDMVEGTQYFEFGEPLLFQLGAHFFFEGDASRINLHPIGWAAWFGMLATSLNLLPVGQLDGGHIVYALVGPRGHQIASYLTFGGLILLSILYWPMAGYLVFALFLLILRFRHPRPFLDHPLEDRRRYRLAFIALLVFSLTFIPVPVKIVNVPGF